MVVEIRPADRTYRGHMTKPERWATWQPRKGDVLVCTPPKCGTTWTQTIIAMLLNGGPDLPDTLGAISPWVDADLGVDADTVAQTIAALPGRRVVKTHTPADGFPVWDGVYVVAVYRHPLDMLLSLRKHIANRHLEEEHVMTGSLSDALMYFLSHAMDGDEIDDDDLALVCHHYTQTVCSGRIPGLIALHYSDMTRDPMGTVQRLATALDIDADAALIKAVAEATSIGAMRKNAGQFAPVGGTGFWKDDAAFFATGGIDNWRGTFSEKDIAAYTRRLAALLPDPQQRAWLERGAGAT